MDENPPRPAYLDAPFPPTRMPVLVIWGVEDKALPAEPIAGAGGAGAGPDGREGGCGAFRAVGKSRRSDQSDPGVGGVMRGSS